MLELRPNCEWCDTDLPPDFSDDRICSYECSYCAECVENVLYNVCATCGGSFRARSGLWLRIHSMWTPIKVMT
ncbi:DUF1272 domain-containing protein [Cypionkella sp.]|uniref:DUF1272 domain-containing protein n=1 Tax=Cypionkella sp. TaxID=2811411 RepID=UPI0037508F33